MSPLTRRALLGGGLAATAGALLAGCTAPPAPRPAPSASAKPLLPSDVDFLSGSSCIGAADGEFARWRRKPLGVTATWAADGSTQVLSTEWKRWQDTIDYSPQYALQGAVPFTWDRMAAGAFDARIRKDLAALRTAWGDRPGGLNYRFQHEFNGDWFPWSVREDTAAGFVAGWQRFSGLFRDAFADDPRFRLVWCANGGTPSKGLRDIRTVWPGDDAVDVVAIDYYDFFPVAGAADWRRQLTARDAGGGPVGIGAWQEFAGEHGKPLALPEWGNQHGDNPYFIEVMHEFIAGHLAVDRDHAAGKVLYEVYFNQLLGRGTPATSGDFRLQARGRDLPGRSRAAARYRDLWGGWSVI